MKYKKEEIKQNFNDLRAIIYSFGKNCQDNATHQYSETIGFLLSSKLLSFVDYLEKNCIKDVK